MSTMPWLLTLTYVKYRSSRRLVVAITRPDYHMLIRIGHSPDPDDAFMFHAMTTGLIDTDDRRYEHCLLDIETLNQKSMEGKFEVSAVSIHSYPKISHHYALTNCGASMGEGYGPILISNKSSTIEEATNSVIAIPGLGTSAYLGLRLALGDVKTAIVPFDEIIPSLQSGEYDFGVIIHEGQLTWSEYGMHNILDFGEWWRDRTGGLPLPLGGNIVRKDLGENLCSNIADDIKHSILYALENPDSALEFAKQWGRGIDDDTNRKFVGMYVNSRTIDYGPDGREAVRKFLREGQEIGLVEETFDVSSIVFVGSES